MKMVSRQNVPSSNSKPSRRPSPGRELYQPTQWNAKELAISNTASASNHVLPPPMENVNGDDDDDGFADPWKISSAWPKSFTMATPATTTTTFTNRSASPRPESVSSSSLTTMQQQQQQSIVSGTASRTSFASISRGRLLEGTVAGSAFTASSSAAAAPLDPTWDPIPSPTHHQQLSKRSSKEQDPGWFVPTVPATANMVVPASSDWGSTVQVPLHSNEDDEEEDDEAAWQTDNQWFANPSHSDPADTMMSPALGSVDRPIVLLAEDPVLAEREKDVLFQAAKKQEELSREDDVREHAAAKKRFIKTQTQLSSTQSVSQQPLVSTTSQSSSLVSNSNNKRKERKGILRFFGAGRNKRAGSGGGGNNNNNGPRRRSKGFAADSFQSVDSWDETYPGETEVQTKPTVPAAAENYNSKPQKDAFQFPVDRIRTDDKATDKYRIVTKLSGDDTTVSEMTNPTYFQRDKMIPAPTSSTVIPPINNTSNKPNIDPFDVANSFFSAGDPFKSNPLSSPIKSDEFSDPFFPERITSGNGLGPPGPRGPVEEDLDDAPDPDLHLPIEDEASDSENQIALSVKVKEEEKKDDFVEPIKVVKPLEVKSPSRDFALTKSTLIQNRTRGHMPAVHVTKDEVSSSPSPKTNTSPAVTPSMSEKLRQRQVRKEKQSTTPERFSPLRYHPATPTSPPPPPPPPAPSQPPAPESPPRLRSRHVRQFARRPSAELKAKDSPKSSASATPPVISSPAKTAVSSLTKGATVVSSTKATTPAPIPEVVQEIPKGNVKALIGQVQGNELRSKPRYLRNAPKKTVKEAASEPLIVRRLGANNKVAGKVKEETGANPNTIAVQEPLTARPVEQKDPTGVRNQVQGKDSEPSRQQTVSQEKINAAYRGRFNRLNKNPPFVVKDPETLSRSLPTPPPPAPAADVKPKASAGAAKPPTGPAAREDVDARSLSSRSAGTEKSSRVFGSPTSDEDMAPIMRQATTDSLSSVGSDIRRLRSILRRSRLNQNAESVRYVEPLESAFAVYDEKHITDPMQRAGLRLLSAAVVPIQTAARRHLALRKALTRMWAIVVIQAATRRWLIRSKQEHEVYSAILIQSVYRGGVVRDQLLLEQCCAIEIQRFVRGFLATLNVYEDIYRITLVQSVVRRRLALNHAMDRMVAVIHIQSMCRGILVRQKMRKCNAGATKIQTLWRMFYAQFNYQLSVLDVVIVQSIWRRKLAQRDYHVLQMDCQCRAATLIQSHWRSYDCTMNYLHFLADVLIVQSAVRRWMAVREAKVQRHRVATVLQCAVRVLLAKRAANRIRSAIVIQKTWRGFICYADYMFTVADIVTIQSLFRKVKAKNLLAVRKEAKRVESAKKIQLATRRRMQRKLQAALTIQKIWRGFVDETEFIILMYERKSAITIQAAWRRFIAFTNYCIVLECVIKIQAFFRGHFGTKQFECARESVQCIQSGFRRFAAKRDYRRLRAGCLLEENADDIEFLETNGAICIQRVVRGCRTRKEYVMLSNTRLVQAVVRGFVARKKYERARAAVKIQSTWRCYTLWDAYKNYILARRIQSHWRGYNQRMSFKKKVSAREIQKVWRGHVLREAYITYIAARRIQAKWRGYSVRDSYVNYVACTRIQTAWRRYSLQSKFVKYVASRCIQSAWRRYLYQNAYGNYTSARSIQAAWRGYICRTAYIGYVAARFIQAAWRRYSKREAYVTYITSRRIQAAWRGYLHYSAYTNYMASRQIQAAWRGYVCYTAYKNYTSARRIQAAWRGYLYCTAYKSYTASRRIQTAWRGYLYCTAYKSYTASRRIQTAWRGYLYCTAYKNFIASRRIQAAWRGYLYCTAYQSYIASRRIQAAWRGYLYRTAYITYIATRRIQTAWRCHSQRHSYVTYIACKRIQCAWRRYFHRDAFVNYIAVRRVQCAWRAKLARMEFSINRSAMKIQATWRGYNIRENMAFYLAARKIQTVWRGYILRDALVNYVAVRRIQASWRGYCMRKQYIEYSSARRIQTTWRGYFLRVYLKEYLAARTIQTRWRGYFLRAYFKEYMAASRIQAFWRGVSVFLAFKEYKAACRIQAAARRIMTRTRYLMLLAGRQEDAAISIQNSWRRSRCQNVYWHALGSVIQMQAFVRGYRQRFEFLTKVGAAITIQCAFRCVMAAKELKQRRFIIMLLATASPRSAKKVARKGGFDEWEKIISNHKEQDRAARTIQRFFLMVKAEVDREIRNAKKRRKAKKKLRQTWDECEDYMLEDVWRETINEGMTDAIRQAEEAVARELIGSMSRSPSRRRSSGQVTPIASVDFNGRRRTRENTSTRTNATPKTPLPPLRRPLIPPEYREFQPENGFRVKDDDQVTEISAFSGTSAQLRLPPSRFLRLSSREIDEDFHLEEAFIDAEIKDAKERRKAERNSRRRSKGPSGSRQRTSSTPRTPAGRNT